MVQHLSTQLLALSSTGSCNGVSEAANVSICQLASSYGSTFCVRRVVVSFLCLMSVLPLKPCQKKKEKLQIWHITTHVEISAPHFTKDSSVFVQLQLICLSFCFSDVKAMTEIEGLGLTAPTMTMTKSKDKSFPSCNKLPDRKFLKRCDGCSDWSNPAATTINMFTQLLYFFCLINSQTCAEKSARASQVPPPPPLTV